MHRLALAGLISAYGLKYFPDSAPELKTTSSQWLHNPLDGLLRERFGCGLDCPLDAGASGSPEAKFRNVFLRLGAICMVCLRLGAPNILIPKSDSERLDDFFEDSRCLGEIPASLG